MNEQAISKLQQRIADNLLQDEEDLLFYIQYASRMASLGDSSCFEQLPKIIQDKYANIKSLDSLLINRCKSGIWDIQEQTGKELGLSLIEAQDFWCFYRRAANTGLFSESINTLFNEWFDESLYATIDEETVDFLERFLETWPLPEEDILPIISCPIITAERELVEQMILSKPLKQMNERWLQQDIGIVKSQAKSSVTYDRQYATLPVGLVLACDSNEPSDSLLRAQDRNFCSINTIFGEMIFQRSLNDRWSLILEVDKPERMARYITQVRIGCFRMTPVANRIGRWKLDIKQWSARIRMNILMSPTVLLLQGGTYLTINY